MVDTITGWKCERCEDPTGAVGVCVTFEFSGHGEDFYYFFDKSDMDAIFSTIAVVTADGDPARLLMVARDRMGVTIH